MERKLQIELKPVVVTPVEDLDGLGRFPGRLYVIKVDSSSPQSKLTHYLNSAHKWCRENAGIRQVKAMIPSLKKAATVYLAATALMLGFVAWLRSTIPDDLRSFWQGYRPFVLGWAIGTLIVLPLVVWAWRLRKLQ